MGTAGKRLMDYGRRNMVGVTVLTNRAGSAAGLDTSWGKTSIARSHYSLCPCGADAGRVAASPRTRRPTITWAQVSRYMTAMHGGTTGCPICCSSDHVAFRREVSGYRSLYCSSCRLLFSDPMAGGDGSYYQGSRLYEDRSEGTLAGDPSGRATDDWRYVTCFRLLPDRPGRELLDIGCGDGAFLAMARSRGFAVHGIDIDPRAVRLAREARRIDSVEVGSWEALKAMPDSQKYDVISLFDVLEHLPSPSDTTRAVFERLRPGGSVCITVPRLDRRPSLFDSEVDAPPHHLTLWTSVSLTRLLVTSGFEDVCVAGKPLLLEDMVYHVRWRARRWLHRRQPGRRREDTVGPPGGQPPAGRAGWRARRFAAGLLVSPLVWVLRITRLGKGFTLLATGRKPGPGSTHTTAEGVT